MLAKHDENYMPKEVVEALKASGEWQRGEARRLMTIELGHFALILAFAIAAASAIYGPVGLERSRTASASSCGRARCCSSCWWPRRLRR